MVFEEIDINVPTNSFIYFLDSLPDKKILHFHYNPFNPSQCYTTS